MDEEENNVINTIVLTKPLPKRIIMHMRHFVNGKRLDTEEMHRLISEAGYVIDHEDEPTSCMANEYKGIRLICIQGHGGMVVKPRDPEDFEKLMTLLEKDEYFFRRCYFPKRKK